MACEHCSGSRRALPLDDFATDDGLFIAEACIEGVDSGDPVLTVNADGAFIYIRAIHCPMCGEDLRGDA